MVRDIGRRGAWAAGVALVFVAGLGGEARGVWPIRQAGGEHIVQTPHYIVRTELGADVAQMVASQQEALYVELVRRMGDVRKPPPDQRFSVLVLPDRRRYERELAPEAEGSRGIFIPAKDVLACWGGAEEPDLILETLRHEGTHQLVWHCIGPQCPMWLNEGLAVFYEHAQFRKGGLEVGQVPPGRVASLRLAIQEGRLLPLARMRSMTNKEWVAAVNSKAAQAALQYDEAWAMVHFLAYGGNQKYRASFLQFIYYVARGEKADQAWERALGRDDKAFEDRWREYVEALQPSAELDCRAQLQVLGLLLPHAHPRPEFTRDMAVFRQAVLDGHLGKWTMKSDAGFTIASGERDRLAALFRCPNDKRSGVESSYELVPNPAGGPPGLRCRHHGAVVLETVYAKDPETGKMDVRVVARPAASAEEEPKPGDNHD